MSVDESQPPLSAGVSPGRSRNRPIRSGPRSGDAAADRAHAFGRELVAVHTWLRNELSRVTEELDAHIAGDETPIHLQAHCLTFCQVLTNHHRSEDDTAFPALARQFPELTPVLQGLSDDHHLIADILDRMQSLLITVSPANAREIRGELSGLSAIVESHFRWEERRIASALDQLVGPHRTSTELLGIDPSTLTTPSSKSE